MTGPHPRACPECGVEGGQPHGSGCAYQPPRRSAAEDNATGRRGAIPFAECRRRGWSVVHVPGEGLRPCRADEPGAYLDLDRYAFWLDHGDVALHGNEDARA